METNSWKRFSNYTEFRTLTANKLVYVWAGTLYINVTKTAVYKACKTTGSCKGLFFDGGHALIQFTN